MLDVLQTGDGYVSVAEIQNIVQSCIKGNGVEFTKRDIESFLQLLSNGFDGATGLEELSFNEFFQLINQSPGLLENVGVLVEQWLLPPLPEKRRRVKTKFTDKLSVSYIKNNLPSFMFYICVILANVGLIYERCHQYWKESYLVILARCAGQCLNFTSSLLLILMLRKCFTLLRSLGAASYLPLDHVVHYHVIVGYLTAVYAVIHSASHVFNYRMTFSYKI